ncbi:TPA: hypothetical protein ACNIQI_001335 [Serratia marcescens]
MLLLLCWAAGKATVRETLSLPRSALRGRRFLPPLRTENRPYFSPFRTAHCPLFVHARQSDDLLRIAVTSRCKTGKNKQLVTG